ncbi:MAG TPA: branched-chain amino acid ABC transporter permease [Gammaproteobacteria bacterium]|nr:branched-chain amino acid ABC transporter permease [Gammaproteobacteria bacterium]
MALAINVFLNVVSLVSILTLIVLGFAVIAGMMGIFNFAHGEFVLLGACTVFFCEGAGLSPWLGMLIAPVGVFVVGLVVERLIIRRFYGAPLMAMLGTYALGLSIRSLVEAILQGQYYKVAAPLSGVVTFAGASISEWRLAIIAITLVAVGISLAIMKWTTIGLQVRAALENPSLARAAGLSTNRIYMFTFAFGAGLAGLAGALVVPIYSLYANLGVEFLLKAFLSVLLGGFGSLAGPVLGAGVIAAGADLFPWIMAPVFASVLVVIGAVVVAKLLPNGLAGLWRKE